MPTAATAPYAVDAVHRDRRRPDSSTTVTVDEKNSTALDDADRFDAAR